MHCFLASLNSMLQLPGLQGLPGSSEARFVPQRPEDAAYAAINGKLIPSQCLQTVFFAYRTEMESCYRLCIDAIIVPKIAKLQASKCLCPDFSKAHPEM